MQASLLTSPLDASVLSNFSSLSLNEEQLSDIEAVLEHELDVKCSESALYWGQNWTYTENPKWEEQGLEWRARFPKKSYFAPLFAAFRSRRTDGKSRLF